MKNQSENELFTHAPFCRHRFYPVPISLQKDLKPRKSGINTLSEAQVYADLLKKYIHM